MGKFLSTLGSSAIRVLPDRDRHVSSLDSQVGKLGLHHIRIPLVPSSRRVSRPCLRYSPVVSSDYRGGRVRTKKEKGRLEHMRIKVEL